MPISYKTIRSFASPDELRQIISNLDRAELREVYIQQADGQVKAKNAVAVWNVTKNKLETIATGKYTLVQHSEAFRELPDAIPEDAHGFVTDEGGRVAIDVLLNDDRYKILPPDGHEVKIGIRAVNSINRTAAFTITCFGYRAICRNGMVLGKQVFSRSYQLHRGGVTTEVYRTVFQEILGVIPKLNLVISDAYSDTITKSEATLALMKLGFKRRTALKIEVPSVTNRWELYCALTQYITYKIVPDRTEIVCSTYHSKAEKLLMTPIQRLIR